MTTLTNDATVLDLPDDLIWTDEFDWSPVVANERFSIGGAPITDYGLKLSGQPMTLTGDVSYGWSLRSTVETLEVWKRIPNLVLTLNYRSVDHQVRFDNVGGRAVEAKPLVDYDVYLPGDFYVLTLRFLKA